MSFADLVQAADRAIQSRLDGVTASYAPEVGDAVDVVGIFDANYRLEDRSDAGIEQIVPAFFARLEDLPAHPDDDDPTITIDGIDYRVRERQLDGTAGDGVMLLLHRVSI